MRRLGVDPVTETESGFWSRGVLMGGVGVGRPKKPPCHKCSTDLAVLIPV